MQRSTLKRTVSLSVKVLVSLALLTVLISQADVSHIVQLAKKADRFYLGLAFMVYLSSVVVAAYRWHILLRAQEFAISFGRTVAFYFMGFFFNNFLPTSVGGDTVRAYKTARESSRLAEAVASVFTERVMGLVGLLGLALVGLARVYERVEGGMVILCVVFLLGVVGFLLLMLHDSPWLRSKLVSRANSNWGIRNKMNHLYQTIQLYREYPFALVQALCWSVVYQLVVILSTYLVGVALHLDVAFIYFLAFVPLIGVISMVPVSINALGIREGGYVLLLARVGQSSNEALALSLLVYGIMVAGSLPGGLLFMIDGSRTRKAVPEQESEQSLIGVGGKG